MQQHPTYTKYIKAVILSANDILATVLLLYEDEGYAPLDIATVELPPNARTYREKSKNGKSLFQRGDLIRIDCQILEHKKAYFSEANIEEFSELKLDTSDEDSEVITQQFEEQKNFAKHWADLEKQDKKKRVKS